VGGTTFEETFVDQVLASPARRGVPPGAVWIRGERLVVCLVEIGFYKGVNTSEHIADGRGATELDESLEDGAVEGSAGHMGAKPGATRAPALTGGGWSTSGRVISLLGFDSSGAMSRVRRCEER
jgi:hypothetical protein